MSGIWKVVLQSFKRSTVQRTSMWPSSSMSYMHTSVRSLEDATPTPASTALRLTPEQAQKIDVALKALETATRIAKLTLLTATYRDIHLVGASLLKRVNGSLHPLTDEPKAYAKTVGNGAEHYPFYDTTHLPDTEVPAGMPLQQSYMDKIACWSALQPNHIEMSSMLLHGINLFPPQEASYPTYVDFDAVIKGLEQRKSRKRMKLLRKLRYRQDKYQLKVWNHYPGHQ